MTLEISPEPDEEERRAIQAALAAEDAERAEQSPRASASLPTRDGVSDDNAA